MADDKKPDTKFRDEAALAALHHFEMDQVKLRGLLKGHFQNHDAIANYCFGVGKAMDEARIRADAIAEAEAKAANKKVTKPKPRTAAK